MITPNPALQEQLHDAIAAAFLPIMAAQKANGMGYSEWCANLLPVYEQFVSLAIAAVNDPDLRASLAAAFAGNVTLGVETYRANIEATRRGRLN